ncbi:hypothetical protein KIN20_009002 [Parelaphostrongylus tenuis]|uniref:Uncharacterized protein n=1 Tax=Parelaphostrongylus tenuis TaxID=148309 RepID=A0AAD5MAI6_PARTN|nr:hypothetical protein KIN20_009002 [Parelaphostrongylus tenuis]
MEISSRGCFRGHLQPPPVVERLVTVQRERNMITKGKSRQRVLTHFTVRFSSCDHRPQWWLDGDHKINVADGATP